MRNEHDEFNVYETYAGLICADGAGLTVYGWQPNRHDVQTAKTIPTGGGCYGYVLAGEATVQGPCGPMPVPAGHWFTTKDGAELDLDADAWMLVLRKEGHDGVFGIGHVEDTGRLCYIDGARDTVLQAPYRKGEACINALYVPHGVHQTMHTHPSTRIGFVMGGKGYCETRVDRHTMRKGAVFFLPENGWHKFRTDADDCLFLNIWAFHPDSDFGPSDEEHPMLNRTMVHGKSAKDMPEIQTQR